VIVLFVFGYIAAYLIIATVVGAKATVMYHRRATSSYSTLGDAAFGGTLTGIFWPVGVCILVGARLMDRELEKAKRREAALKAREKDVQEREALLAAARQELEAIR
jgi:hypothetical protein